MSDSPDAVDLPAPSLPDASSQNGEDWMGEMESSASSATTHPRSSPLRRARTLAMVETAFLASTASLIWLINYYFPLGPVLKIFFPIPIALIYMRWGLRAAGMGALVAGLLLSVLMGPTRSIVYLIPYGLMGVQLGACWRRNSPWLFSVFTGSLLGTFGFFFRFWLFSILLGEDLWQYVITQATGLLDWVFIRLGLLIQPDFTVIQGLAVFMIFVNSLFYLFTVHLVGLLVFDRLGNPIPRPPAWLKVILEYD